MVETEHGSGGDRVMVRQENEQFSGVCVQPANHVGNPPPPKTRCGNDRRLAG